MTQEGRKFSVYDSNDKNLLAFSLIVVVIAPPPLEQFADQMDSGNQREEQSGEQIFFDYLMKSYRCFLYEEDDQFAMLEAELAISFGKSSKNSYLVNVFH